MTLAELVNRIDGIVQDRSLKPFTMEWINNAILEIASDFELPALRLKNPITLPVDTTNWLWNLPDDFHKKLFRCESADHHKVWIFDHMDSITRRDSDHDKTGPQIKAVAAEPDGLKWVLGVYPLADDELKLWYYRKPAVLKKEKDVCDCIPPEYHERVIVPRVIVSNYQMLQDQVENFDPKGLAYWEGKLTEGLNGAPRRSIGLINYLTKLRGGPKRHGGRDPVGWKPYRYGY